ncbi:hypothetical protein KUTeg_002281 [Tegillarca granosa]|uniref:Uncharacterized protein n=1 Tax=Tegillarca granosa TaxID=220873 RepID=A0ABQ9FTV8_TEGGR|nr:hypothetical protein KUTeg_002281 [Tegillarca granosa]
MYNRTKKNMLNFRFISKSILNISVNNTLFSLVEMRKTLSLEVSKYSFRTRNFNEKYNMKYDIVDLQNVPTQWNKNSVHRVKIE